MDKRKFSDVLAGDTLDLLVAKEVMGWGTEKKNRSDWFEPKSELWIPEQHVKYANHGVPAFSSNTTAAFLAVDAVLTNDQSDFVYFNLLFDGAVWIAKFMGEDDNYSFAYHQSKEVAICLSALNAIAKGKNNGQ